MPADLREKDNKDLETGLQRITDDGIRQKAKDFINAPKLCRYWFQPEEKNISAIFEKYGGSEMRFAYEVLSTATHGYHIGMGLFADDSDQMTVNPMANPKKTRDAILYSSRHLLELINIRNTYEGLGLDSLYDRLIEKLISFKK